MLNELSQVSFSKKEKDIVINTTIVSQIDKKQEEYNEKHIVGSILIPYDKISAQTVKIDKDKTILVYCRSGKRAATALEKLKELGYTAYNMGGLANIDLPKE